MSRVLFSVISILLLSMASASYGVVIGDFEAELDGWVADQGELTFSPIGATSNWVALQVSNAGGWKLNAKFDAKAHRAAMGVKGTTITADVTAFEADIVGGTWMNIELVVNAQNNDDAGANNNIGWKSIGARDIVRDGQSHKYTWEIPDDLAAAIALTDGNIWWFEIALVSNTDGTAAKFYVDNIELNDPAKKIVFVSFHGADDAPTQKAVDVGWTEATDKAYTDLLTANGYKVTRYITTGTPDANLLNASDLVIISRAAPSGNYQNAAATNWNTQITAPMMILGGYIIRKERMGYTTGGTMVDITGDVKLAVSDPNHPIFAGVALTNGVMDNPYAGIAVYPLDPNIINKGISINNNPANAEGTVLATIAPPADPNDPNDPNDTFDPITGPVGGMVIAEWPAGATLTHNGGAGTDVLAGPRLVFLTGSREPSGVTGGEAAGIYDLYDDGAKMFLNAVNYMLNPPLPPATNLLVNGGFEDGTTTGWNVYGPEGGVITTVVTELTGATVADGVIEGTYCLYVDIPTATANFWEAGLQPQGIVFQQDKKYTFSAFMKSKAGTLQVNMKPELAADPWTAYNEKMVTVTEEWQEFSVTTPVFAADTAPAGFTFHIGSAVGGFWVDGVRYFEGDYVAP